MGRRKAPPQSAPSTLAEAITIIERYLCINAEADRLKADADLAIIAIQTKRDECLAPMKVETDDLFLQLRAWWAVAGPAMTEGKRKSIELAGALIGERTTPPALKLPRRVPVQDIIDVLLDQLGGDFLVTTHKLDKPAIIRTLRLQLDPDNDEHADGLRDQNVLAEDLKLSTTQREEFFIDRAAPKDPDPELVDAPVPAIAEARP